LLYSDSAVSSFKIDKSEDIAGDGIPNFEVIW